MGGGMSTFNLQDGFLEGIVRGNRQALLTPDDYRKLCMAETLEGDHIVVLNTPCSCSFRFTCVSIHT